MRQSLLKDTILISKSRAQANTHSSPAKCALLIPLSATHQETAGCSKGTSQSCFSTQGNRRDHNISPQATPHGLLVGVTEPEVTSVELPLCRAMLCTKPGADPSMETRENIPRRKGTGSQSKQLLCTQNYRVTEGMSILDAGTHRNSSGHIQSS